MVVIGGGFIAMEVSSVLAQKGIETTMVLSEDRIWKSFFSATMSKFFEKYYEDRHVRFAKNTNVVDGRRCGEIGRTAKWRDSGVRYGRGGHWCNSDHGATTQ